MFNEKDINAINAIRTLSIAQIESANSGHPGLPMGASPMAYVLWNKVLNVNPEKSDWHNRDRFVLSAGHGSAMLYSLLHLSGFDLSIEDLKNFRQIGSKTPGHPERKHTDGVEVTTGPLGQGIANAVGFAIAEKHLAALYNKEDLKIVDHYTYAICGDGDLMEGISYESMSLAGHLNLNKLIILHDSNDICLDGDLKTSFSENIEGRVKAQNWNYLKVDDGNDLDAIYEAINKAKESKDRPSFIEIKTIIGYGSLNQGTNKVHGAPIGFDDYKRVKKFYNWSYDDFEIPENIYETFRENILKNGKEKYQKWLEKFKEYKEKYPEDAKNYISGFERKLDENWIDQVKKYSHEDAPIATRASSGDIIQDIAKINKNFWGGSADLFSSNKTDIKSSDRFKKSNPEGRNLWYGVREFAMSAIANAIVAHGGSFHHISTFFVFSDYLKAGLRLSALSHIPVTYVFTHDSVAVGEDGPTHQPIEQLAMIRAIPNTIVLRPCDANEVRLSWKIALESKESPVVIALTRQNVSNLEETEKLDDISMGAYIIKDSNKDKPDGIIIATGSEVELAIETREELLKDNIDIRVVSMPSFELFRKQSEKYKEKILPKDVRNRVSIEMGTSFGWSEFTGNEGLNIAVDSFGISGNFKDVKEELGFDKTIIAKKYKEKFN
ncbi:transketolase [Anaerococcus sp. AGMB00486]|uniref:Transketolase n=2 Tax=Anaerococcus TaxID=165779 RepID=A0ABX2N7C2_9FIRM|nr:MULTISPECIES: transketolase [Anaerococcus]MSS76945.1 transketolase [Anaerococcus porci]NVF10570.1 transketolase [Anaerococcus faecalis]